MPLTGHGRCSQLSAQEQGWGTWDSTLKGRPCESVAVGTSENRKLKEMQGQASKEKGSLFDIGIFEAKPHVVQVGLELTMKPMLT